MKILVAGDGSTCTPRIVDYLAAHADLFGAEREVDVLYVVEPLPHRAAAHVTIAAAQRLYDEDADSVLREIGALFEHAGIHARGRRTIGRPAEAIARNADEGHYDLLVLGSSGHGRLASVVLGSVVTEVLARTRTPVLIVP